MATSRRKKKKEKQRITVYMNCKPLEQVQKLNI